VGWRPWIAWLIGIGTIFLLGALRTETDVELTFASFAFVPVLVIAWIGGKNNGLLMAFISAGIWVVVDVATHRQFSAPWIPWVNATTRWLTYSLVVILTTQVRLQFVQAIEYATRDSLTGLLNRRSFLDIGEQEANRSKRYGHTMAVVFIDLDNFKKLKDSDGHEAGDAALQATAKILQKTLRSNDLIARLGGDEFAILLPESGYDESKETGTKISVAINETLKFFPFVSGSIGVACFSLIDRTFSEMIKAADELMYEAKKSGKGGVFIRQFP
jgi:diguanylate cyclase (GGDEF)-like protein